MPGGKPWSEYFGEERDAPPEYAAFIAAYNRARSRVADPIGALVLQRRGRLTVGMWRDAAWQALRSQPLGKTDDHTISLVLGSMRGRLGGEGGVLYCFGPMLDAPAGWRAVTLGSDAWA